MIGKWAKGSNLTEKKLAGLIQSNHLDIKYGITVTDVIADIRKYKNDPTYNPFPTVPVAQSIGIVDDLQREKKADSFLISRYIKRMSDDYGYDEILISEIVNMWCDEYTQYLTNN